ncbi:MAG: hypothetical protein JWO37_3315 [Acidimicrobiales bacterium]|nr:hypothetical protein [Acidimicrobiales bacterium]
MSRRLAALLIVLATAGTACSGGSGSKHAASSKASTSTSSGTTATTATGDTAAPGTATASTVFTPPTLPKAAPAGAVPFDIFGNAGAVEPVSGMLGVVLGPLPNGFVLVEAKSAAVNGVTSKLDGITPGTPVHVVGYSENVNGVRLITATRVDAGPQAVPH